MTVNLEDVLPIVPILNDSSFELKKQNLFNQTQPKEKVEAEKFRDYHDNHSDFFQFAKPIPLLKRSSSYYTKQFISGGFKWNSEYQHLVDEYYKPNLSQDERANVMQKFVTLGVNFAQSAEEIGKTIIREYHLPINEKTILPTNHIGGQAGGIKYIHDDILFKFAVDNLDLTGDDNASMKIAGHELLSLDCLMACKIDKLRFPLVSLIDFRGYRLIAISLLPIHNGTLQYGSADAGKTIHSGINREADGLVQTICTKLNLKPHQIAHENAVHTIYGPVDLECHLGEDDHFYLVDFSRVFPPDRLDPSKKCGYLYQILRPEIVRANPSPLCSDSLTKFVNDNAEKLKNDIETVNHNLINNIIPSFAKTLTGQNPNQFSLKQLIDSIHRQGINIRYLGILFIHTRNEQSSWSYKILIEILARVCKRILNQKFRDAPILGNNDSYRDGNVSSPDFECEKNDAMETVMNCDSYSSYYDATQLVDDLFYCKIILHFFNLIFSVQSHESSSFWKDLPPLMNRHFYCPLDCFENLSINKDYPNFYCELFERIQYLTNIQFVNEIEKNYIFDPNFIHYSIPFTNVDSILIKSKLKHVTFMQYCNGMIYKHKAKSTTDPIKKQELYKEAVNILLKALEYNSSNVDCLLQIATICHKLGNIPAATQYYRLVINSSSQTNFSVNYKFAKFLHSINSLEAERFYVYALSVNLNHSKGFIGYANFLWRIKKDYETSFNAFNRAFKLVSWDSPVTICKYLADSFRGYLHQVSPSMPEGEINDRILKYMPFLEDLDDQY